MAFEFKKAERKQARLRLAVTGPSGAGKTYSALKIAIGIGGKIGVIDTERGSASLYSSIGDYDTLVLDPPYSPSRFIECIRAGEKAGFDTLILDSITHEWFGSGGCLELNEEIANSKYKGNTWSAWNETKQRHRQFLDAILQSPCHIIATMRSKTETAQEGRKVIKLGMKAEQQEGAEYEFTTVLDLVHDGHFATVSKDRTGLFIGKDPEVITENTGRKLLAWLNSGAKVVEDVPKPKDIAKEVAAYEARLNAATTEDGWKSVFKEVFGGRAELGEDNYNKLFALKDEVKHRLANCGDRDAQRWNIAVGTNPVKNIDSQGPSVEGDAF